MIYSYKFKQGEIKLDFTTYAQLTNSSVLASMGDTSVLITISSGKVDENSDYFPLSVEYIERFYASGMISSSRFIKREGHPSVEATLKGRMIDRSIRPLFPEGFKNPVQVLVTVLSYDEKYDPIIVSINALSAALSVSDLPFEGPIYCGRVIKENQKLEVTFKAPNNNEESLEKSYMNIVASCDEKGITMIDADSNESSEEDVSESFKMIIEEGKEFIKFVSSLKKEVGKPKYDYKYIIPSKEILTEIENKYKDTIAKIMNLDNKRDFDLSYSELVENIVIEMNGKCSKYDILTSVEKTMKKLMKYYVFEKNTRIGNRKFDEVRKLTMSVGMFPRAHGSALFQREGTQVITMTTLGSTRSAQLIESIEGEENKRYMHHYNTYPYCFGTQGKINYYPGRREIGHGALAEKSLIPVIPNSDEFPYTIRLVTEVLMSEGSTSMASVCGSTLSLMDAGVPIKKMVAGISVGLIAEDDYSKYQLLLDVAEGEDFYGKMDFKVSGTRDGITAIQMDNKIKSIPVDILIEALKLAKDGRIFVLNKMEEFMSGTKKGLSQYAPKYKTIKIKKEKIGELIGPGGKNIRKIIDETGVDVDVDDEGNVNIFGIDEDKISQAYKMVDDIVGDVEIGKIYEGTVAKIMNFGAFVEIKKGVQGLVHVSEISDDFIKDVTKVLKEGDRVNIKVVKYDDMGRLVLSIKQAK